MAKAKAGKTPASEKMYRPAITPEGRESQMIALAVDAAEKKLRDGTASPSIIVHYLKLASPDARLEREKLEKENELLSAKTEAIRSAKRTEELFAEAMKVFKTYSGQGDDDDYSDL